MPELPEVEIIKLGLQKKIIGQRIKTIRILNPKTFQDSNGKPFKFAQGLRGQKVLNVWRRAKILGIDLSGDLILLFHLKMTGQLVWMKSENRFVGGHPTSDMLGNLPNSHTRVIFEFSDGSKLYFNDQRRFGWIKMSSKLEFRSEKFFEKLGPEPLEKGFSQKILKENLLKHLSMPIKVAIMDQTVVAGVGNIYASEALFLAQIHPGKKVGLLSDLEIKKLHKGIIKSLQDGIAYRGSTMTHFKDTEGKKGDFLSHAFVYRREGQKCKKCKLTIKKFKIAGRGTYFCPNCQDGVK